MSEPLNFTFPLPPSLNHYLVNHHRTPAANAYRDECRLIANLIVDSPLEGRLVVVVDIQRVRKGHTLDLDNCLKVLFDSLNGVVWHDDSQVVELHCYAEDSRVENPQVELAVWQKEA